MGYTLKHILTLLFVIMLVDCNVTIALEMLGIIDSKSIVMVYGTSFIAFIICIIFKIY